MKYAICTMGTSCTVLAYSDDQAVALKRLEAIDEDQSAFLAQITGEAARRSSGEDLDYVAPTTYDPNFDVEEALRNAVTFGIDGGLDINQNSDEGLGHEECPKVVDLGWRSNNLYVTFEDGRKFVVMVDVQPARDGKC